MIIIKLKGGLGNQMFQYALGRFLQSQIKVDLLLDATSYSSQVSQKLSISHFDIKAGFANNLELESFKKFTLYDLFDPLKQYWNRKYVYEQNIKFDGNILKIKRSDVYLKGYWPSEKYFKKIKKIIYNDFQILNRPSRKYAHYLNLINKGECVSIHIRRGDSLSNNSITKLTSQYYQNAYKEIKKRSKVKRITTLVFSDDLTWSKNNIPSGIEATFVENMPDFEDLILMSKCHHNIIANSTFSWWAGWLNRNPHKIVIAPKKWFINDSETDLIPPKWLTI